MNSFCVFGIAGFSGSGKTTLICRLLPELAKAGFSVGVLKHVHHELVVDRKGKDTDSFYRAGAAYVYGHDAHQGFSRFREPSGDIREHIRRIPTSLDLLIVEGHKGVDLSGIILSDKKKPGKSGSRTVISRSDPSCLRKVYDLITAEMNRVHSTRPICAGLLVGGKSERMGSPKALLKISGQTLASRSFKTLSAVAEKTVLLGNGPVPKSLSGEAFLPDAPDSEGPLSGMLSAFRWSPKSAWIVSSVDMPLMSKKAWNWLLSMRRPGAWAVIPRIKGKNGVETTGAIYEPMLFDHVEALAAGGLRKLQEISKHPRVITPVVPGELEDAWRNINTPRDMQSLGF